MAWAEVPFKVSNAPTNGVWDANTTWYFIQFPNSDSYHTGGYLAAEGNGFMSETNYDGKVSKGKLLITQTEKPMKYSALWCIVGDETNGYRFFNKMNPHLLLGMPTSGSEARMYNNWEMDGVCYAFAYAPSTSNKWENECVTFRILDGNKYWNNQDAGGNAADFLRTWAAAAAQGDNGSAVRLTEATEHDLDEMAATLPEEGHYYVIKSVRSGKYAAYTADNTQLAQQDRNESSEAQMWYFTVDGNGYKLHNLATDKLFAGTSSFTDNGTKVYVKENPYCAGYVCVSTQENLSGNCWDEQGPGTKIGTWGPRPDDFQGTSWILEEVERPLSEISYTIIDALGNTFTGTYNGFAGETLPTITGGTFEDVIWSENSVTTTISYTIENIGEEVTIEIHDARHRLYVVGDDVKVAKEDYSSREGYTASNAVWLVCPSMTDGVVAYTIKHKATGKWVVAASTTGHNAQGKVTLTATQDNATKFEVETHSGKPCFKVLNQQLYLSINSDADANVYLGLHGSTHFGTRLYFTEAPTVVEVSTLAELQTALADNSNELPIFITKMIEIPAGETVELDLNGKTVVATDNATGSYAMITNQGDLTIVDGSVEKTGTMTLTATNDRDWNAYSSVISNTVGGKLTVNGGTIEHLGGTDMAYAIDNLTNGKGTYAETIINGGAVKSTYRAIRQFLNGTEAQNILTVNGGTIEGANKSIWMQDPSKNANTGTLTVAAGAKLTGDVYLFVTAGSTEWPVSVSIAAAALQGESKVVTGNVPAQYVVENVNGTFGVAVDPAYGKEAFIGETYYATLAAAVEAAQAGDEIVIIADIADVTVDVTKNLTISGAATLNNVGINANGADALTVEGLTFTGNSWINSGTAEALTVSGITATVAPNNTSYTNSRSAFISLGRSEGQELALTVENNNITVKAAGSDAILGWAKITAATITGNVIKGSNDGYFTNADAIKFMSIADGAEFVVNSNEIYSNYNGIVFAQNTTRDNAYSVSADANKFYGGADHIWIEITGGNTVHATFNATSANTVNGNAFTVADIKYHDGVIKNWTSYAGVDVVTDANGKVIGGTLASFSNAESVAEGCAALPNLNGQFVVGVKPTATVNDLGMTTVAAGEYSIWDGSFDSNTEDDGDMPLSFVMQFLADQTAADMATSPFADWYGDFVLTFTGLENESFTANGCYLAGHYGSFGWVKVPVDGMKIEKGVRYPVMLGVGLGQKYDYICSGVEDFRCALYLTPEILAANPNIQVKLELGLVDNSKGSDAAATALVNNENVYSVTEYTYNAEDFVSGLTGEGTEANPYLIMTVEDLILFRNSVNAGETKYSAPGVHVALGANIDLAGENWTPIGNAAYDEKYQPVDASKVFSGVFDGKGKVISNLNVSKYVGGADEEANVGLFAVTGDGAVIKNLTLTNVKIETDGRNVGAVAGFAYKATLSNIVVNGNIQIKGGNNVAGVAGMTRHYAMSATNISVSGAEGSAIVGNNIVGGIFAEIAPNGSEQKFDGLNVENVAITGVGGVGGIVGLLTTGAIENVSVKNVVLTGRTDYQGNAKGRIRLGSVAGLMGGKYATIAEEVVENVTAKNLNGDAVVLPVIGANYDASSNAAEAKIGNTYYATFKGAYQAAQEGETITLLAPVVVAAGETLTLDKNVSIVYTSNVAGEDMFTNRGTLDISAGTITYANTDATASNVTVSTISSEPGSELNITGGTVENKTVKADGSSIYSYAIDMLTNGNLGDVTATISGGTVYSDYMAIRQFNNGTACENTLNITGGYIYGAKRAVQIHMDNNAAVTAINGGKIEAGEGGYAICNFAKTSALAVTGGEFIGAVYSARENFISGGIYDAEVYAGYCAEGFICQDNGNGTYGVIADPNYIAELVIDDAEGEELAGYAGKTVGILTYKRELSTANVWQPLYVPFGIQLSEELLANFDIAYFNAVMGYDDNDDQVTDRTIIEVIKIEDANAALKANYPLIIRAKSAEKTAFELTMENVTMGEAKEHSVTCESVSHTYEIKGTYTMYASIAANQRVLGLDEDGKAAWGTLAKGYSLKPYRLILTINSREDADLPFGAIRMRVVGEEDEDGATAIYDVEVEEQGADRIFDLQGRRVLEPQKGNLYIINGKKVVIK